MPQKECDKRSSITFFHFRDTFGHFSAFSDASVTFFVTFFARLLLPDSFCGRVNFDSQSLQETRLSLVLGGRPGLRGLPQRLSRRLSPRAKGALIIISEPRFSTPCAMRFFPREKGKTAFVGRFSLKKGRFPFLAGEKSHLAGGRKSGLTNNY